MSKDAPNASEAGGEPGKSPIPFDAASFVATCSSCRGTGEEMPTGESMARCFRAHVCPTCHGKGKRIPLALLVNGTMLVKLQIAPHLGAPPTQFAVEIYDTSPGTIRVAVYIEKGVVKRLLADETWADAAPEAFYTVEAAKQAVYRAIHKLAK